MNTSIYLIDIFTALKIVIVTFYVALSAQNLILSPQKISWCEYKEIIKKICNTVGLHYKLTKIGHKIKNSFFFDSNYGSVSWIEVLRNELNPRSTGIRSQKYLLFPSEIETVSVSEPVTDSPSSMMCDIILHNRYSKSALYELDT